MLAAARGMLTAPRWMLASARWVLSLLLLSRIIPVIMPIMRFVGLWCSCRCGRVCGI